MSVLQLLPNLRSPSIYTIQLFTLLRDDLRWRLGVELFGTAPELYALAHREIILIFRTNPIPEVITGLLFEPYL